MQVNKLIYMVMIAICSGSLMTVTSTADYSQDQSFRLMNIERRLDQLQSRVDFIERTQQNQAMQSATSTSNLTTEAVLELQRMNLSLAGQVVQMQKRMLDMQKAIDRISEREGNPEKKEKPEPKTKAPASKP